MAAQSHPGASRKRLNMKVAFRTDASSQIGTGHVTRCLTLADALAAKGAQCMFICREHPGNLIEQIRSKGHGAHSLPMSDKTDADLAHAAWLGASQAEDAQVCAPLLADLKPDWLVVDHYALDARWESTSAPHCCRLMVIDDLADRAHACDLFLDQNYGSSVERYDGLVRPDCAQCHGPQNALLKPVYAERRAQLLSREGQVRRVLIYFGGGADAENLTGIAVQAFQAPELAEIELDVVVGAFYAHQQSLETLVAGRGKACIYRQLPHLADLMANADLAIGAGGATTWERCCIGLPSIVISIAENQRPACEALSADHFIYYLGHGDQVNSQMIRGCVSSLVKKTDVLRDFSKKGMDLVDGKGVSKVLHAMTTTLIHQGRIY